MTPELTVPLNVAVSLNNIKIKHPNLLTPFLASNYSQQLIPNDNNC